MKKHLLTNSKSGGGITKLNSNAFTLIELLAIIVILAIIAVITVPIILNIIENSKKGAAQDSAYGFKDSINKYYVDALSENKNLKLEGEYTVSDGNLTGKFEGPESTSKTVTILVSGEKPSSGKLRYSNNVLNAGCVVIGEYKVTFDTDGKVDGIVKGDCESYEFPSDIIIIPTVDSCPGCVYAFYTTSKNYGLNGTGSVLDESEYTNNYTTLNKNYFLGHILDENGKIERAFACGINNGTPYCVEGTKDGSKNLDNRNFLSESIFNSCDTIETDEFECYDEYDEYSTPRTGSAPNGYVYTNNGDDDSFWEHKCEVNRNGTMKCS